MIYERRLTICRIDYYDGYPTNIGYLSDPEYWDLVLSFRCAL